MPNTKAALGDYWEILSEAVPDFSPDQQRIAVSLYRELARGKPITAERLATVVDVPRDRVAAQLAGDPLNGFVYTEGETIVGFGGLAVAPMHHEFEFSGRKLWTWCAWDSLFIPSILRGTATVASPDPQVGDPVRLTVSPTGIERVSPEGAVVSFLVPDTQKFGESAANVMASFCHHVFFFTTSDSARRWQETHPDTFLYSVEDAFALGQRLVQKQFGHELSREVKREQVTR